MYPEPDTKERDNKYWEYRMYARKTHTLRQNITPKKKPSSFSKNNKTNDRYVHIVSSWKFSTFNKEFVSESEEARRAAEFDKQYTLNRLFKGPVNGFKSFAEGLFGEK